MLLRLTEGDRPSSGILQVYDGISSWGGVCWSGPFHTRHVDVACRQLGYPWALSYNKATPEEDMDYFIRKIICGHRLLDSIEDCTLYGWIGEGSMSCNYALRLVCFEGEFIE